ncbi:nitroreductase/quinone reductase family protein [Nocardia sp. BMG51109]|uniref:nitroreductase/quinone reductase family protein n=1 Tax=Nocardia sp. BMG51109 TaxID=1056816 RepID=UPI0004650F5A|nr:nitroreductase/quinone reductase family protein [Nocardia sp. BMG51109]
MRGRLNNVMVKTGPLARAATRFHVFLHARGRSSLIDRYFGAPLVTLTVRGRRTGRPRSVLLILTRRGDDILVTPSNAGSATTPAWFLNLMEARTATVDVAGQRWEVAARRVDGDERRECWSILVEAYPDLVVYQRLTNRTIPVVVLERVAAQCGS